jgi:hypothetical protein
LLDDIFWITGLSRITLGSSISGVCVKSSKDWRVDSFAKLNE